MLAIDKPALLNSNTGVSIAAANVSPATDIILSGHAQTLAVLACLLEVFVQRHVAASKWQRWRYSKCTCW